jgi:hypothetical protein
MVARALRASKHGLSSNRGLQEFLAGDHGAKPVSFIGHVMLFQTEVDRCHIDEDRRTALEQVVGSMPKVLYGRLGAPIIGRNPDNPGSRYVGYAMRWGLRGVSLDERQDVRQAAGLPADHIADTAAPKVLLLEAVGGEEHAVELKERLREFSAGGIQAVFGEAQLITPETGLEVPLAS